jgi:SAM-dependent MidA family methyltransferase
MSDLELTAQIIRSLMKELRAANDDNSQQMIVRQLHRLTDHLTMDNRYEISRILAKAEAYAA